ncbi:MAG: aminoacyl-tRNA hydrolase [Fibrobacterota bacterium]
MTGRTELFHKKIILAMPQTFMNLSGRAVLGLLTGFRLVPQDILVVFDDADLPLGHLRFRTGGGHGGHNGIRSIVESIGPDFHRLKVGIGRPDAKPTEGLLEHVLAPFSKAEAAALDEAVERSVAGIETLISHGMGNAMEKYNRRPA